MTELERQLATALRALSEQFERDQTRQAERVEALQQQMERLEGVVTRLSKDYRAIAETLRGR